MSSKIVSSAEQTLHYCSKLNCSSKKPIPDNISTISLSSRVSESRNSTKSLSGSLSTRGPTRISALHAPMAETAETLYQVLGIAATGLITISDIKKAYKQMARKYHPDVSPPDRVDEYTRMFVMVHMAYETLSDPHSRALYDGDLAAGGFGFLSSTGKSHQYHEEMDKGEWKTRWESQLDGLKRRSGNRDS
ncbi:hypothetical protein OROGR_024711 [Orobanche gracilis]